MRSPVKLPRPGRPRRGAITLLAALSVTLLLGVMALVLDGGLLMAKRRHAQAVADAAAMAAVYELHERFASDAGLDPTGAAAAVAREIVSAHEDAAAAVTTVRIPPTSGAFAGKVGHVEVVVEYRQPRLFSALWGQADLSASARAVGRREVTEPDASILLLDPSRSGALALAGSGRVITNAGIQVNSTSQTAVTASNMGFAEAPTLNVGGSYSLTSSGYLRIGKPPQNRPSKTGAAAMADPLASLPPPPASGPVYNSLPFPNWGTRTMSPGVYNFALDLGGGMTVNMEPGVYYMKNGFRVANGVKLTGVGVTIYVGPNGKPFDFQGGGQIRLEAPTTGPYAGILLYQDRNSTKDISIANGTSTTFIGTFYAPNARVIFAGGNQTDQMGSRLIFKSLDVSNNAHVRVTASDNPSSAPPNFQLVE